MITGRKFLSYACAVIAGIAAAVIAACIFDIVTVHGHSMEPSVKDGSRVLVNRLAYFAGEPEAGDAVAFSCDVYSEDCEGRMLVRRVAATEGDTVEIKDGKLYINGTIYEAYEDQGIYLEDMEKITVGKGSVFVLSDTGQAVLDSRDQAVGQLVSAELGGKVLFK